MFPDDVIPASKTISDKSTWEDHHRFDRLAVPIESKQLLPLANLIGKEIVSIIHQRDAADLIIYSRTKHELLRDDDLP
jgi:hypothetical protein